jgi:hypothetical protein
MPASEVKNSEQVKHTPGPWEVLEFPDCYQINGIRDHQYDEIAETGDNTELDEANARLISAAPELLEALRGLLSHVESWKVVETAHGDIANARAAISKATGQDKSRATNSAS